MRVNLPVSQREHPLEDGQTLLSTTDLKGRITYANDAFIAISGFSREELYGKAHNLVRHPDMPEAAFADLWRTIQSGRTWSALVKNRRKDGDHYWVRANATPVRRGGEVVGYLSVRTKPAPDEILAHATLYARIAGQAGRWCVHRGQVLRAGWAGLAGRWRFVTYATRLQLVVWGLVAAGLGLQLAAGNAHPALLAAWCLCGAGAALALHLGCARPVARVAEQARAVASGELAEGLYPHRADAVGSLMRAIEQAGLNLRALVADMHTKSQAIDGSVRALREGNEDLAARTEEAAASLEQTSAAMGQLVDAIHANSATARQAAGLAEEAVAVTSRGAGRVGHVAHCMQGIAASSRQVADITALIDGIAFQTNILALNAAVEAARAGDHGKGFAVVAAEVRALSLKSASAARDIKGLIDGAGEQVSAGARAVADADQAMREVRDAVTRLSGLMHDIRGAGEAQAQGVEQVNAALGQLEQMTQHNRTLVQRSADLSGTLAEQAARLEAAATVFQSGAGAA